LSSPAQENRETPYRKIQALRLPWSTSQLGREAIIMKTVLQSFVLLCLLQGIGFAQGEVDMQPALKKQLNVFFSNFSECNFQSFKQGELTDQRLLDFALWNCTFNLLGKLKRTPDGNSALADAALIDSISEKYFGLKPGKHEKQVYQVDLASGEAYVFSQVDTLTQRSPDTYQARGTIYYAGSGSTIDPHATPAVWKKQGEKVKIYGTFTGQIRKVASPKEHYILEQYEMLEKNQ
jgi:hypothetical protein